MKTAKFSFLFILILVLFYNCRAAFAGNYDISTYFEIEEDAINLFLRNQFREGGSIRVIDGETQGINYTFYLSAPVIELDTDAARINLKIDIVSDLGNYSIEVEPEIHISSFEVSSTNISAAMDDFADLITGLSIPAGLKDALIAEYNALTFDIYPNRIVKNISDSELLVSFGIEVSEISISVKFLPTLLQFEVKTTALSILPDFDVYLFPGFMAFESSVNITVDDVIMKNAAGQPVMRATGDIYLEKNEFGYLIFEDNTLGFDLYPTVVVYARKDSNELAGDGEYKLITLFIREYNGVPDGQSMIKTRSVN